MPIALASPGAGVNYPPYAPTDSRVILDIGVGGKFSWAQAIAGQYGFSVQGSGTQTDPVNGFNGGVAGALKTTTAIPGGVGSRGTIYIQMARSAICEQNMISASLFADNQQSPAFANQGIAFQLRDAGGANVIHLSEAQVSSTSAANLLTIFASGAAINTQFLPHQNSHASSPFQDPYFGEYVVTWNQNLVLVYLDGQLISQITNTNSAAATLFNQLYIGMAQAATNFLGNYWIKRFQITNNYSFIPMTGPRMALLGDSFVGSALNSGLNWSSNSTAAQWLANQNFTTYPRTTGGGTTGYSQRYGQTAWGMGLQAMMAQQLGFTSPMYCVAEGGAAWGHNGATGNIANEMHSSGGDAIIQFSPEILIALVSSMNDVGLSNPPTTLGADTLAKLQYIATGKYKGAAAGDQAWSGGVTQYPVRLRQIICMECPTWQITIPQQLGAAALPAWSAQNIANGVSCQAALTNAFVTNGVNGSQIPITYIPTRNAFLTVPTLQGIEDTYFDFTLLPGNRNDTSNAPDFHLSATGMLATASILAPVVLPVVASRPTRANY